MLTNIRVIKIDSDLSDRRLENGCKIRINLKIESSLNTMKRNKNKYTVLINAGMDIGFAEPNAPENDSNEGIFAQSSVEAVFEFSIDENKFNQLEDDVVALDAFSVEKTPEIYPHLYNKVKSILDIQGAGRISIPLSFESFSRDDGKSDIGETESE